MDAACEIGIVGALQGLRQVRVAAGLYHTLILSEAGDIYVCGCDNITAIMNKEVAFVHD